jgi:penicillin-binding protein 1B
MGTGRGAAGRLRDRPGLAGKTGSTDGLRDSWFAGFSNDLVAVVWLGRDDNRPAGLSGSQGALQVWADLMSSLPARPWSPPAPPDVEWHWVDSATGAVTDADCPHALRLPFLRGTAPRDVGCGS